MSEDPVSRDFNHCWSLVMERYSNLCFQEALEIALDVRKKFPERFQGEVSLGIACIYSRMSKLDDAVQSLERALSNGHWWSKNELLQIPALAPLRERLDFAALVENCDSLHEAARASSRPELLLFTPPDGSTPRTMMLALHGRAETAQTFAPYWKAAVSTGVLLAVPGSSQPFRSEGPCWDEHQQARTEIASVYSRLQASNPAGFDRTIVAGYSQGGELALSLALIPEFPCTGFIAVAPGPFSQAKLEELSKALEAAAHRRLRGYLFSGDRDPTYSMTRKIQEEMSRRGILCEFVVGAEMGHDYPSAFESKLVSAIKFVLS